MKKPSHKDPTIWFFCLLISAIGTSFLFFIVAITGNYIITVLVGDPVIRNFTLSGCGIGLLIGIAAMLTRKEKVHKMVNRREKGNGTER